MSIDRRLHRLESGGPFEGARIAFVASAREAENLYVAAIQAGAIPPLCIITKQDQSPAVVDGGTIADVMRSVAANGWRVQDRSEESTQWRTSNPDWTVWRKPEAMVAHR